MSRSLPWAHFWMVLSFTELGIRRGRTGVSFGMDVVKLDNAIWLFLSLTFLSLMF